MPITRKQVLKYVLSDIHYIITVINNHHLQNYTISHYTQKHFNFIEQGKRLNQTSRNQSYAAQFSTLREVNHISSKAWNILCWSGNNCARDIHILLHSANVYSFYTQRLHTLYVEVRRTILPKSTASNLLIRTSNLPQKRYKLIPLE